MKKNYIQPNYLFDRFEVASVDKIWSIDDTKFNFCDSTKKLSVLFIVDLCSRKILKTLLTKSDWRAPSITKAVEELLIEKKISPQKKFEKRLIIHTDRASHFTSVKWDQFGQKWNHTIVLSMSDQGCPKQNAISERLNHTIKNCFVQSQIVELKNQSLKNYIETLSYTKYSIKELQKIIEAVVYYYNNEHIHRILQLTPEVTDQIYRNANLGDPPVVAVRNNGTSCVEERLSVALYKNNVLSLSTDLQENFLEKEGDEKQTVFLKRIQRALFVENQKLAQLTQAQYQALSNKLDVLSESIAELKKKPIKEKQTFSARDPIFESTFQTILKRERSPKTTAAFLSVAQFRIALVLMYLTGSKVNEIKLATKKDILYLKKTKKMYIGGAKRRVVRVAYEKEKILEYFAFIENDIKIVFDDFELKYLGACLKNKNEGMTRESWIRAINRNLQTVNKEYKLNLEVTSHTLRTTYLVQCLTKKTIEEVRQIAGHQSIQTTLKYTRYSLNEGEK